MRYVPLFVVCTLFSCVAFGAESNPVPQQITVSIDADLITFFKSAIELGGAFLFIYAIIGVIFFGWDVKKAHDSIIDAQREAKDMVKELNEERKEVKDGLKELLKDQRAFKDLKERLEQLGAKLQEESESHQQSPVASSNERSNIELIRQIIESSDFEWTTIGRIMNKTGLSRNDVLQEARAAPDIEIGYNRQTQAPLFKISRNISTR